MISVLAQDPTGFSSPLGQVVSLLVVGTSLALAIRWWIHNRKR